MILNYLLAFSILVMSVIKVTDFFIHSDHSLNAKRLEFIKETKRTHQDGSITLMGILLTLMVSALLMFFALKFKVELAEARYRKDSYLCFHYLNIKTENYIFDMTILNWSLRSAYAAQFTAVVTAPAKAAFEALKLAQNIRHLYYVKELITGPYCEGKLSSALYLKDMPYRTKGLIRLETNIDNTTFVRKNKWKLIYYKSPAGIRLKNSFCLQAEMELQDSFFPNFKIKTKEIAMADFSKLKCLAGFR